MGSLLIVVPVLNLAVDKNDEAHENQESTECLGTVRTRAGKSDAYEQHDDADQDFLFSVPRITDVYLL